MITFKKLQLIKELITLLVDDYTTGLLLKVIAIDLSIQEALGADLKAIQQINFTENLAQNPVANTTMFFVTEEAKETILYF